MQIGKSEMRLNRDGYALYRQEGAENDSQSKTYPATTARNFRELTATYPLFDMHHI